MRIDMTGDANRVIQSGEKRERDILPAPRGERMVTTSSPWLPTALPMRSPTVDDSTVETQFLRLGRWSRLFLT